MRMVFEELEKENIETEIIQIGNKPIRSCIGCGKCYTDTGFCSAFKDDGLNEAIEKIREADGILLGSPVHFSGITGAMKSFCDRLVYIAGNAEDLLFHKVGAAVTAVRRTGGSSALNIMHKYLQYCEMMVATSNYWGVIHGRSAGEVQQDEEGKQIMRILGKNMVWHLKMREQGLAYAPAKEKKVRTDFIR
jgi:multimeric flavodoxin WrbA